LGAQWKEGCGLRINEEMQKMNFLRLAFYDGFDRTETQIHEFVRAKIHTRGPLGPGQGSRQDKRERAKNEKDARLGYHKIKRSRAIRVMIYAINILLETSLFS
jgi:hypothetical protein